MKHGFFSKNLMYKAAETVVRTLRNAGADAWFVGGCVRDMLLGKQPKDIDVVTTALPDVVQRLFEKAIPLGASFGIITVVIDDVPIEVATCREERGYEDGRHPDSIRYTDDPKLDVRRRDFTINALLYDPVEDAILDFCGGQADLKAGLLRTVGNPDMRFEEDSLRLLRAVRFASRLGFRIDPETELAIMKHAPQLTRVSAERIRDEVEKILLGPDPETGIRMLSRYGLLRVILPEVEALHGLAQPPKFHPEGDVFEHTMLMLSRMAWKTPKLVWSVLLHDVGKAKSQTFAEDGTPHFYGHETIGADMAEAILKRLRLPNDVIAAVTAAVRNHMRFAHIDKMKASNWKRIAAEPDFGMEMELNRLDCTCSNGLTGNYVLMLDRLNLMWKENEAKAGLPPPLLTGKDLIEAGCKPGIAIGQMLREVADLQLEGVLKTKEEALAHLNLR